MSSAQGKIRRARDLFKRRKKLAKNIRSPTRMRIQYGGELFTRPKLKPAQRKFIAVQTQTRKGNMKKMLLSIALAVVAPFAWGQVSETTTTTTTTEGNGTITEYSPGSVIVLRESSGPRRYRFGKTVTYVTRSGRVLDEDTVRTRIKVGVPVRVHYVGTGENVMVDRVIIDED